MEIIYSDKFLANSKRLPVEAQRKLAKLLDILEQDPFHPLLHSKRLSGELASHYSFRITRDWRVIFLFEQKDIIKLTNVGNRTDIYR